jgi:multidrug resistance efflux pump
MVNTYCPVSIFTDNEHGRNRRGKSMSDTEHEKTDAEDEKTEVEAITPIYKITRIILVVALVMFIWYLFADRLTPSTTDARVRAYVIPIVPQVSGSVVQVVEEINQLVDVGDVLIKIDPEPYRIAIDQAEAALQQAGQCITEVSVIHRVLLWSRRG